MKSDIKPFRMYGNLYFVGSSKVSVHVIKTEKGLVMIDTGYPDMYEQIVESMEYLGLDVKDLCAIFHSHGHYDHIGCTERLRKITGAKTYISRIDNEIVNGNRNLSWAEELGYALLPFFNCDVLIEDGDCFAFGSTVIRCVLTPGHTEGTVSYFVNIEEGETSIVAAMHGGAGMGSMRTNFLEKRGLSFDCRRNFKEANARLKKEKVDLFMGNHPEQNDTVGKLLKVMAGESIIDKEEWQRFLSGCDERINRIQ